MERRRKDEKKIDETAGHQEKEILEKKSPQ
jgi:hypothetical protein